MWARYIMPLSLPVPIYMWFVLSAFLISAIVFIDLNVVVFLSTVNLGTSLQVLPLSVLINRRCILVIVPSIVLNSHPANKSPFDNLVITFIIDGPPFKKLLLNTWFVLCNSASEFICNLYISPSPSPSPKPTAMWVESISVMQCTVFFPLKLVTNSQLDPKSKLLYIFASPGSPPVPTIQFPFDSSVNTVIFSTDVSVKTFLTSNSFCRCSTKSKHSFIGSISSIQFSNCTALFT